MKEMKTTAQVLVDCLEAEGVDVMFGIPGEETLDLMFAIRDSKIRFIPVRHEQGAAFMADVYGRLTGRAGVCLSTLGPGATNLVTGVADAYLDGAPLVAITGQVGTDRMQLTSHQYLDLTAMFEPITKRSKQIIRPDTVGEISSTPKRASRARPISTCPRILQKCPPTPCRSSASRCMRSMPTRPTLQRQEKSSVRRKIRSSLQARVRCAAMPPLLSPSWLTACTSRWSTL